MLCRKLEKKFDLYYYDGLARQEEEIKLTIGKVVICKISLQKRQGNETRASSVVAEMRVTRARFVFCLASDWFKMGVKRYSLTNRRAANKSNPGLLIRP